jgi:hypothetical protein
MASKNSANAKKMMVELEKKQIKTTLNARNDGLFIISHGLYNSKEEAMNRLGAIQNIVPAAFIKATESQLPIQVDAQDIKPTEIVKVEEIVRNKPTAIAQNATTIDIKKNLKENINPRLASVPYTQTDDQCIYKYNCGVSIKDIVSPSDTKCKFITIKYNCTDPV